MEDRPPRPLAVTAAAGLLLGSAVVLLAAWASGFDAVESNGARVFFVVLWGYLAWCAYGGGGWVRTAIFAVFAVGLWGGFNAPSWAHALAAMPPGETLAKALAVAALVAMCLPPAHRYFAAAHAQRNGGGR